MPRLFDLFLSKKCKVLPAPWNIPFTSLERMLAEQQYWKELVSLAAQSVYEVTNVCEYFYKGTDQEYWVPEQDFPCMAPPGYVSWYEYNRPTGVRTTRPDVEQTFNLHSLPKKTGVMCAMLDARIPEQRAEILRVNHDPTHVGAPDRQSWWQKKSRPLRDIDSCRMLMKLTVFFQYEQSGDLQVFGPIGEVYLWLDENFDCFEFLMFTSVTKGTEHIFKEGGYSGLDNFVYPVMLTLTMLNLRNVTVSVTHPDEGKKRRKQREKWIAQHGQPRMDFKTLEITPVVSLTKLAMDRDPQVSGGVRKVRSHVYRGHVLRSGVDGRKCIFGNPKIVGRFWIAPGTRGSKESGEVVKTYKVGEVKGER